MTQTWLQGEGQSQIMISPQVGPGHCICADEIGGMHIWGGRRTR